MEDPLTPQKRSELMAKVRSKGNRSTEMKVLMAFEANGLTGWVQHPPGIIGKPDFFFPGLRLALFVDGCFWHGCPECGRIPKTRIDFWTSKIESNRQRDLVVAERLLSDGYEVVRVWEHELGSSVWFERLAQTLGNA